MFVPIWIFVDCLVVAFVFLNIFCLQVTFPYSHNGLVEKL